MLETSSTPVLPSPSANPAIVRANLDAFGLAIVPDMLDAEMLQALRQRLDDQMAGERAVAGLTHGPITYVRALIGKGAIFRELIVHERALEFARHVLGGEVTLSSYIGNAIGPGAPGGGAHTDQVYLPYDTPHPVVCNVIYMLDDFTEDNGATLVVPGSHKRPSSDLTPELFESEAIPVTGPAGSALIMESRIFHSIGVNRTKDTVRRGILAGYSVPFLRPQFNWSLGLAPEIIEAADPTLRELLGFKVWRTLGSAGTPANYDGSPLGTSQGGRTAEALTKEPKLDTTKIDWGWVPPRPDRVRELDATGSVVAP